MLQLQLIRKKLFLNHQQQYILRRQRQKYERYIFFSSPSISGIIKRYYCHHDYMMSVKNVKYIHQYYSNMYKNNRHHHIRHYYYYHSQSGFVSKRKQQQKTSPSSFKQQHQQHHHIQTGILVGIYATICGIGSAIIMANDNLLHNIFVPPSEPK